MIVGVFLVHDFGEVGAERSHNSVTEKDAQEGSHEGSGDLVPQFFGRAAEGAHGDNDAKHGSDDAQAGSESATVLKEETTSASPA